MSDHPKQPGEFRDLGDLFDQATDEQIVDAALGGEESEQDPQPERRAPPPTSTSTTPTRRPPVSDGGYGPLIRAKEKEIGELEKKVENFRNSENYIYTDEEGNKQFDGAQLQADNITLQRLNRELNSLIRKRDESQRNAQTQTQSAYKLAKRILEQRVRKLPKEHQEPVVRLYGKYFKSFEDEGFWGSRNMQEMSQLQSALEEMLDTVIGKVMREKLTTTPSGDRDMSADDHDDDPEGDEAGEGDDDVTKGVMYAYEQRKANKGKTIGDIRRAQAERRKQEREQQ